MARRKKEQVRKDGQHRKDVISKEEIEQRIDDMNSNTEQKVAARREDDLNRQKERDNE